MFKWLTSEGIRTETNPEVAFPMALGVAASGQLPDLIFDLADSICDVATRMGVRPNETQQFLIQCGATALSTGILAAQAAKILQRPIREGRVSEQSMDFAVRSISLTGIDNFAKPERENLFRRLRAAGQIHSLEADLKPMLAGRVQAVINSMFALLGKQISVPEFWGTQTRALCDLSGLPSSIGMALLDDVIPAFSMKQSQSAEVMKECIA